jgi:hypothetical protein
MLVGVAEDDNNIYQLKPSPWTYTNSDWVLFLPGTGVPKGTKKFVESTETITVLPGYQYFVYGDLTVEGVFNNYGEVVIANGNLILQGGGQFNNLGLGTLTQVNLATGDSVQVVIETFSAVAGVPLTLTHNLETKDFTFNVREGNTLIDVQLTIIDDYSVEIVTTSDVTSATIIFQAKLD